MPATKPRATPLQINGKTAKQLIKERILLKIQRKQLRAQQQQQQQAGLQAYPYHLPFPAYQPPARGYPAEVTMAMAQAALQQYMLTMGGSGETTPNNALTDETISLGEIDDWLSK